MGTVVREKYVSEGERQQVALILQHALQSHQLLHKRHSTAQGGGRMEDSIQLVHLCKLWSSNSIVRFLFCFSASCFFDLFVSFATVAETVIHCVPDHFYVVQFNK